MATTIYPWSGGGGGYVTGLESAESPLRLDLWMDHPSYHGPVDPGAAFLFYQSANSAAGECAIEIGGLLAPTLDRVISVNRTLPARGGGRVVVTSLELWSSLIVFNVAVASSEAGGAPGREELQELAAQYHFTSVLVDDLGNSYPPTSG